MEKNQYNRKDWIDNYRKTTLPEFNLAERLKKLDVFVDKIKEITEESDKEAFDRGIRFVAEITYPFSMGEHGFGYEFEYKTKPNTNDIVKDTIEFYREEAERLNKIGATTYYEEQVRDILNQ